MHSGSKDFKLDSPAAGSGQFASTPGVYREADLRKKITFFASECHQLLAQPTQILWHQHLPARPARSFQVPPETLKKPGLTQPLGQAWLLHDLANIELQAAELFLRSLHEYPDAPSDFRHELAELCLEEVHHLELCLNGLEKLGHHYGDFPIHFTLWNSCAPSDTLIDRIFIVHMYLEASGLDSGDQLLRRLRTTTDSELYKAVKKIAEDELRHVQFGTRWYANLLKKLNLDPDQDFSDRLRNLKMQLPARGAKPNDGLRSQAGFTPGQLQSLNYFRQTTSPRILAAHVPKGTELQTGLP